MYILFFISWFRFILFIYLAAGVWARDVVYNINVTATSLYLSSAADTVPGTNMHRWHFSALSATMSPFSRFSPSRARANACLHQHIDLDYNLICCGRDGIEQQIIPNEENQSPGVQISRKLVRSDWFGHRRRLGGIWQITASQVDWENSGE